MVHNLMKKGHDVVIFDLSPQAILQVQEWGKAAGKTVTVATQPKDVAVQADIVITMLPSSPHVKEVYGSSEKGIFAAMSERAKQGKKNQLLIDSSTIDPTVAREVASDTLKHSSKLGLNVVMCDAPVSGGVGGAEAGTLTFMVGSTASTFGFAKPVLEKMGKNIVHCGDNGTGQIAKVCNNLVLGISMSAISEAMNLGVTMGMDPSKLAGIINTSSGRCWSSDTYNPVPGVMPNVPASKGYAGGFGSDLMKKDLGLAQQAAQHAKVPLPLGNAVHGMYEEISQKGSGKKDFAFMYQHYKSQNK
jgi:3-hydroxyisobutyrate dehydrogenase